MIFPLDIMDTPPKKLKLSDETVLSVAKEASEIEFSWNKVALEYFSEWLHDFSLAHNVVKEMMMMAVLPHAAEHLALLGSHSFVKTVRQRALRPSNMGNNLFQLVAQHSCVALQVENCFCAYYHLREKLVAQQKFASCGNMLRKLDMSSTFCNKFYLCCS